jgi:hypothetical protein
MRVAVQSGRGPMSGPAGVGNASMRVERLGKINIGIGYQLLQFGNLANFLKCEDLILLVTVDGKPSRIITAIFEPRETCRPLGENCDSDRQGTN